MVNWLERNLNQDLDDIPIATYEALQGCYTIQIASKSHSDSSCPCCPSAIELAHELTFRVLKTCTNAGA